MSKRYTGVDEADPVTVAAIFIDTGFKQYTVANAASNAPDNIKKKIQLNGIVTGKPLYIACS